MRKIYSKLWRNIESVLPTPQLRFGRIVDDVPPYAIERCFATNEVVELILLPEMIATATERVDLPSKESSPSGALLGNHPFFTKGCQQVNVVWHYNEGSHGVTVAVELEQSIADNLRNVRPA
ncbi:MAG: hypothetical protein NTU79_11415 [Planctomycetota bacterium]|nr:hypothetical protein [Planctomycetota bacterium]